MFPNLASLPASVEEFLAGRSHSIKKILLCPEKYISFPWFFTLSTGLPTPKSLFFL